MKKIVECVPNYSEGRDKEKIRRILSAFRGKKGVKLLDHEQDSDHNRLVVTLIGEPPAVAAAVLASVGVAVEVIDLRKHSGQHPRIGAVDVIPFIPVSNVSMAEAVELSKEVGRALAEKYGVPVFLYEESASDPARRDLAAIRKGEFEGMSEKLKMPEWRPDYGKARAHPTAGVVAVGARMPLVAFNVNIDTPNMEIASAIAKAVRNSSGGLRYCKAIAVDLTERGITQVSMNMTDFAKTPLHRAVELVRSEARRYGVNVVGSEVVGLAPMAALIDAAAFYMGLERFSIDQILETRME